MVDMTEKPISEMPQTVLIFLLILLIVNIPFLTKISASNRVRFVIFSIIQGKKKENRQNA